MFSVILHDGSRGWTPNGTANTFVIDEIEVHPDYSTILVNTIQDNIVICAVDYLYADGYFEVKCNEAPADGTTLKYVVINRDPIVH